MMASPPGRLPTLLLGALHALATAIAMPYAILAIGFLMLGEVAGSRGLWGVIETAFGQFAWVVSWGLYAFVAGFAALLVAGFVGRLRRMAAMLLLLICAGSLVVIVGLHAGSLEAGQLLFLAPCAAVLVGAGWLYRQAGQPTARDPA